jgi:transcriptional regulator with XRE-family HTH domain
MYFLQSFQLKILLYTKQVPPISKIISIYIVVGGIYIMVDFGLRLRELRKQHNLTQIQLAELTGVKNSIISFYENGDRVPGPKTLRKLAAVLHVTTDYLLGIEKKRAVDISDLTEEDIQAVEYLISYLRQKNTQNNRTNHHI